MKTEPEFPRAKLRNKNHPFLKIKTFYEVLILVVDDGDLLAMIQKKLQLVGEVLLNSFS